MDAAAVSDILTRAALCGVFLAAFAAVAAAVWAVVRDEWRRGGKVARRVFLAAAAGAALYGGAKQYRASVSYPATEAGRVYLVDRGSYVTNDFVHVDFERRIVPDDAALVIERREVASTNAADWAVYLETTFAAFAVPTNLPCANATNWNWAVWADWTPPPSVLTNGVLHANWGETLRDADNRARGLAVAVPVQTSVWLDGRNMLVPSCGFDYDAEVEWLQGDGTAYVDTGWIPSPRAWVECAFTRPRDYSRNQPLFGTRLFNGNQNKSRLVFCEAGKIRLDWLYVREGIYHQFSQSEDHYYSLRIWVDGAKTRATIDGTEYASVQDLDYTLTLPFLVFWGANPGSSNKPTTAKFSRFKAGDETREFDFVPVRKGRVGYLYDRVSGRLYGNAAATGAFLVGPDKSASALAPETADVAARDALDALTGAAEALDQTPEGETAK